MTTVKRQVAVEGLEQEWWEAWEYAQTHMPGQLLRDGLRAITDSINSGKITSEQADTYLRVMLGEYVAAIATEQVTDYLERHFGPWGAELPMRSA